MKEAHSQIPLSHIFIEKEFEFSSLKLIIWNNLNFKLSFTMEIVKKDKSKMLAIEILAMSPSISKTDLAKQLGISKPTLNKWMADPLFIDTWYKRYMEVAGSELPLVIGAMIREAQHGNVQAGRLILEHLAN